MQLEFNGKNVKIINISINIFKILDFPSSSEK